ncbi:auxin-responsive protein IAA13-like isoform X2 [Andrographis paniculata]|uniref:auxin-responsive protein IAA13-like isoform X2 n=1 Tax=Andrographis paniculata TaxID=175694 RepID=UPI0021E8CDCE|nr:auxin-responsive protein IAA13-like isoform X2 [Andrographis paniculata]
MQSTLQHGGGGVVSGGSMSEENSMVMSSVESSAYPDESELELGLGLSLGCGGGKGKMRQPAPADQAGGGSWDQYARILTAKDFASVVSGKTSSSSLSSSSSSSSASAIKGNTNGSCGTKRTAEPPSSPPGRSAASQFVGWPPIRTYRMNSLSNHAKSRVTADFFSSTIDECKSKNTMVDKTSQTNNTNNDAPKQNGILKTSLFVKVNMDGIPIGRKVDLSAHSCYETLAQALHDMFSPSAAIGGALSQMDEQIVTGVRKVAKLLDGSSEYVLTYEDKDGDWMLVGDVPWDLFLNSVRRLRIMRAPEANGLAPGRNMKH